MKYRAVGARLKHQPPVVASGFNAPTTAKPGTDSKAYLVTIYSNSALFNIIHAINHGPAPWRDKNIDLFRCLLTLTAFPIGLVMFGTPSPAPPFVIYLLAPPLGISANPYCYHHSLQAQLRCCSPSNRVRGFPNPAAYVWEPLLPSPTDRTS